MSARNALLAAMGRPAKGSVIEAPEPTTERPPLDTFHVPPSSFSDEWSGKPDEPIEMGMRLVGEKTLDEAQRMAARAAWLGHPEPSDHQMRHELFGSMLMTNTLARVLTKPRDRTRLFFEDAPEDLCRLALSTGGVRALWDRFTKLQIVMSPVSPELDDEDVGALARALSEGVLERVGPVAARRARRLLAEVVRELGRG